MTEAVLFDFGGTLFDYNPTNYSILADVAREFGLTIENSDPLLSRAFQLQEEYIHSLMIERNEFSMDWMTSHDWRRCDEILLKTLNIKSQLALEMLVKKFQARGMFHYKIFPDTYSTLKSLKDSGIKLGVVSNLPAKYVPDRYKMLKQYNLVQFFSSIVLSGERGVSKPNPEIFLIALKELGVSLPDQVYHIGDSYIFDVIGAKNSSIIPILFDPNKGRNCDCRSIRSLSEIIEIIK